MITGVIIKELKKYEDARGYLSELFRNDEINYQPVMAYASYTNPGVVRGPHEHREQSDCFIFFGPGSFNLHLWDRRNDSDTQGEKIVLECGENNPCLVIVPPGVVHGYKCVSEQAALSLNFPDKLYRGVDKQEEIDEIRWEEDPNSPYKIE